MTIGGSIALIVIGAILRWAINWSPAYVNLRLVGLILMIGGAIGLVISLVFLSTRRRRPPSGPSSGPPTEVYERHRYSEYNEPPV
jgi:hypothetical protein